MADIQRQICVLPHIRVHADVELGNFVLISSSDLSRIPKKYHVHARTFANLYRTVANEITDVGLLVRKSGKSLLAEFSAEELSEMQDVIDALAFSACYRESTLSLARDNFVYTVWAFHGNRPPTDHISLAGRRVLFDIQQNRPHLLQIPTHVYYASLSEAGYDSDLLTAMLRCALSKDNQDRRIMRAVQWFNLAHSDSVDLTDHSRFAMTATAFEALLNTPHEGIRHYFANTVQMLLGESSELAKWAKKFYDDRSALVHGGKFPDLMYGNNRHNSMLTLADVVFTQCVYRHLGLLNYWPTDESEKRVRKNVVRFLISNKDRFDAVRGFRLTAGAERASLIRDYLYSIQSGDASVDLDDCNRTLEAVLKLGIDGLGYLGRKAKFRTDHHRVIIAAYRSRFRDMIVALPVKQPLNVFHHLRDRKSVV